MDLKTYVFEQQEVRMIEQNNEPWFVGIDVADILGYSNSSKAVMTHVDEEDKRMDKIPHSQNGNLVSNTYLINESGLYSLILKSKLDSAKKFKRWVTSEVLPAIRKHGGYLTDTKIEEALMNPDTLIQLATQLKNERFEKERALIQLKEQEPQVVFARTVEVSQNSVAIKVLATILKQNGIKVGQNRLFQWLRDNKFLSSRMGNSWNLPTQRAMDMELFELKPNTYFHNYGTPETKYTPVVTGKGQIYFVNRFIKIEQEA
ncbi:phage antirepressor [Alkalibacterium sp. f15]|uniref:phage antirepressor n=1 Tax=Alkalibacterium sp. f15 TaxID=3414029 RepID=UPI003BF8BBC7